MREASARITAAGFDDRCHVVAGSFLESVPSHGDVYVLAKVLHDWDDDHATRILRNVRAAAPEHARLLIIDAVVGDGNEPDDAKWTDLVMLALVNGRERSEPEWRALLAAGGFVPTRFSDSLVEAAVMQ